MDIVEEQLPIEEQLERMRTLVFHLEYKNLDLTHEIKRKDQEIMILKHEMRRLREKSKPIKNPLTGRYIRRGSRKYDELVRAGHIIEDLSDINFNELSTALNDLSQPINV